MSEKGGRLLLPSRRDLLKSGALLALSSPIGFSGLTQALTRSLQGLTSGPPSPATQPASPEWMKNLIIYEIATKGFTSPKGPEKRNLLEPASQTALPRGTGHDWYLADRLLLV